MTTTHAPSTSTPSYDIGLALTAPTKDPAWIKKCLLMSLVCLVPFAGWFSFLGWIKAYTEVRLRGDVEIPAPGFGYMGAGVRFMVMYIPLVLLLTLVMVLPIGVAAALGSEAAMAVATLGMTLVFIPVTLGMWVLTPAMLYLHLVDDDLFASVAFGRMVSVIRRGGWQFALFLVAILASGVIAQLGMMLLLVGLFLTVPYAYLVYGSAAAEYARVIAPEPAVVADVGGNAPSGSPFGISA